MQHGDSTATGGAVNPLAMQEEALLDHAVFLRGIVGGLLADKDEIDDVVQDTWLAAIERPAIEARSVRGWLAGVARNMIRQRSRGAVRRKQREYRVARPESQPSAAAAADVERLDAIDSMVAVVRALDEPYRSTLLLRYYDGLPPREIATVQGASIATVKTRLRRGLEQIREALDSRDRKAGANGSWRAVLAPLAVVPVAAGIAEAGSTTAISTRSTVAAGGGPGAVFHSAALKGWIAATLIVAVGAFVALREIGGTPAANDEARLLVLASTDPPPGANTVKRGEGGTRAAGKETVDRVEEVGSGAVEPVARTPVAESSAAWQISGVVIDAATSEAFPGARLRVSTYAGLLSSTMREPIHDERFVADESGRFTVELPPPDRFLCVCLSSDEPDHVSSGRHWQLVPGEDPPEPARLSMWPTSGEIQGEVVDHEGKPVEGAYVWHSRDDRDPREARSDASGNYRLPVALNVDGVTVFAWAPGFGPVSEQSRIGARSMDRLDFKLEPERLARGRVVDEEGRPLAGVRVRCHPFRANCRPLLPRTETDADGRFELGGLDANGSFSQIDLDLAGYVPRKIPFRPNGAGFEGEIILYRATELRGKLIGRAGEPVQKARLSIRARTAECGHLQAYTLSGLHGEFRFESLYPGDYLLEVDAKEGPLELEVSAPGDVIASYAEQETAVACGRVVDEDGNPIERARLHFEPQGGLGAEASVRTDADGRFRLEIPTNMVEWTVRAASHVRQFRIVPVDEWDDCAFVLRRAVPIRGRVVDDETGEPIQDFRVGLTLARSLPGDIEVRSWNGHWGSRNGMEIHSTEGVFETDAEFESGAVIGIEVDAPGYATEIADRVVISHEPSVSDLEFRLERAGTISGRVVDASMRPVVGARVMRCDTDQWLSTESGPTGKDPWGHFTTTGVDGAFRIEGVGRGDHSVAVVHADFAAGVGGPFAVIPGESTDCEVQLAVGCALTGVLLDTTGAPVVDASVSVRHVDPRGLLVECSVVTDRDGQFALERLKPGAYVVSHQKQRGEVLSTEDITLVEGDPSWVQLTTVTKPR